MKIMQLSLLVVSMLISISAHADTARKLGEILILKGFTEEDNINSSSAEGMCKDTGKTSYDCRRVTLGEAICMIGGNTKYDCRRVTLGEAICIASGTTKYDCRRVNIFESLCIAGGHTVYDCRRVSSAEKAICMGRGYDSYECRRKSPSEAIGMKIKDIKWAWDMFRNQYGGETWRCRGTNTGQFADDDKCSFLTKNDDKWPN
jgi:hypothetical protein